MNPMKFALSSFVRGSVITAASLLLALPSASLAAEAEPTPEQVQQDYARDKQERKAKDKQQKEEYLRARPHPGGLLDESDIIKMHSARQLFLLTYPTGTMPAMPWTKAKRHNQGNMTDALPWPGEPLDPKAGAMSEDGMRGIFDEAVIAPQNNVWVSYGPRPRSEERV